MKNKVAFIDIDGTLVKGQSQRYFIQFTHKAGFLSFFDFTLIFTWFGLYKAGLASNTGRILNFTLRNFKGVENAKIDAMMDRFYEECILPKLYKFSEEAISTLKSEGYTTVLLSTAVEPIVKIISKRLKTDDYICTQVELDGLGKYTGHVIDNQVYGEQKKVKSENYIALKYPGGAYTLALADHISDQDLLLSADKAFIANPASAMRKWGIENKIDMIYLDKNESVQYIKSHIESQ